MPMIQIISTIPVKVPHMNEMKKGTTWEHNHPYEMRKGNFFGQDELDSRENIDLLDITKLRDSSQNIKENLI